LVSPAASSLRLVELAEPVVAWSTISVAPFSKATWAARVSGLVIALLARFSGSP
jgi:hypothetical protein